MIENNKHDYVIVGAGSAGCVLAHRLTENGRTDVLLLEAGNPDDHEAIHMPARWRELVKSEFDWGYTTTPQPGLNGRENYWPRGKTLGGSSSINAMMYVRGHPWDYDRWERLGNEGWSYENLLPYYIRLEDFEDGASEYHGEGGPLSIARQDSFDPVAKAFVEAAQEVGLEYNDDFNAGRQAGVGPFHLTAVDDQRQSTAVAYLHPVLNRKNLTVETGAHVTRVQFEGDRAVGVEYEQADTVHEATATREVILSAGAIASPQLLMLSGIGPADHLEAHGIDCRVDRPGVGRNLQDHPAVGNLAHCTEDIVYPPESNGAEHAAFERIDPDAPAPDIQYIMAPTEPDPDRPDRPDEAVLLIFSVLLRPRSRGVIALRSADPFDHPSIDPRYFSDPRDLDTHVEGVKRAREIMGASALDAYRGATIQPDEKIQSDDGLVEFVRQNATTLYHPVGTCKMGSDALAVVDDRLRVHGVEGLRVVDASIMPRITSGNTNAPTIVIAERAADMIGAAG
jgi:choline dehydrogenase